jgi:Spy/CpxP family protein refolding chaperone
MPLVLGPGAAAHVAHLEKQMKRLTLLIIGVAAAAMAFSSVWAQDVAPTTKLVRHERASTEPTTRKAEFGPNWAAVATRLDLTDDQKAKLNAILETKQAANKDFQAKDNPLKEQLEKAKQANDEEQVTKLKAQRKALRDELNKSEETANKTFDELLTSAQREKFAGYKAYLRIVRHYTAAELSPDQKAKIEAMCDQNAKAYLAAKDDDTARKDLDKKVDEQVSKEVLTKEQIDKIEEARKKRAEMKEATTKAATDPAAKVQPAK